MYGRSRETNKKQRQNRRSPTSWGFTGWGAHHHSGHHHSPQECQSEPRTGYGTLTRRRSSSRSRSWRRRSPSWTSQRREPSPSSPGDQGAMLVAKQRLVRGVAGHIGFPGVLVSVLHNPLCELWMIPPRGGVPGVLALKSVVAGAHRPPTRLSKFSILAKVSEDLRMTLGAKEGLVFQMYLSGMLMISLFIGF